MAYDLDTCPSEWMNDRARRKTVCVWGFLALIAALDRLALRRESRCRAAEELLQLVLVDHLLPPQRKVPRLQPRNRASGQRLVPQRPLAHRARSCSARPLRRTQ